MASAFPSNARLRGVSCRTEDAPLGLWFRPFAGGRHRLTLRARSPLPADWLRRPRVRLELRVETCNLGGLGLHGGQPLDLGLLALGESRLKCRYASFQVTYGLRVTRFHLSEARLRFAGVLPRRPIQIPLPNSFTRMCFQCSENPMLPQPCRGLLWVQVSN